MCNEDHGCLTRVVGDECDVQVTRLQDVMLRIEGSLHHIPPIHRHYIANALLNLAVSKMTREDGFAQTSSILMRLGDYVASGQGAPSADRAIDLSGLQP